MAEPHLRFERDGHVAIVTFNRPESKNALSGEMLVRMYDAWLEIDADDDIRAAVVTGAGGTFCAGMDLKAFASGFAEDEWTRRFEGDADLHWKALLRHFKPAKPLVAAVEGWALAGGTEILQALDVRVAAETATFGITEVRRGLFPLGGSTVRLSRQIPYTLAAEYLLTGRHIPAPEAHAVGLVGQLVPEGQALDKALELAHQIAANAPLSVRAVLRSLRESRELTEVDGLALELELGYPIIGTDDAKEGARAFSEKRDPVWQGH
jgi:enoyl-CoA hydratase